jgi:hypothetical protein
VENQLNMKLTGMLIKKKINYLAAKSPVILRGGEMILSHISIFSAVELSTAESNVCREVYRFGTMVNKKYMENVNKER